MDSQDSERWRQAIKRHMVVKGLAERGRQQERIEGELRGLLDWRWLKDFLDGRVNSISDEQQVDLMVALGRIDAKARAEEKTQLSRHTLWQMSSEERLGMLEMEPKPADCCDGSPDEP